MDQGANYHGGLSNGMFAGPAALAFLQLIKLQARYQDIVQAKADLTTASAQAAQNAVSSENRYYASQVGDQAYQQAAQGFASIGCALLVFGAGVYGVKKMMGMDQVQAEMADAETGLGKCNALGEEFARVDADGVAGISDDDLPFSNERTPREERGIDLLGRGDLEAFDQEFVPDSEERAQIFTKIRAEAEDGERTALEEFERQLSVRTTGYQAKLNAAAQKFNAIMITVQMVTQVGDKLTSGAASIYSANVKTGAVGNWGYNGISEQEAGQGINTYKLYGQLDQSVMNDQGGQVKDARSAETKIMTEIWAAINQAQRV